MFVFTNYAELDLEIFDNEFFKSQSNEDFINRVLTKNDILIKFCSLERQSRVKMCSCSIFVTVD